MNGLKLKAVRVMVPIYFRRDASGVMHGRGRYLPLYSKVGGVTTHKILAGPFPAFLTACRRSERKKKHSFLRTV
jgi:hypothetical protein